MAPPPINEIRFKSRSKSTPSFDSQLLSELNDPQRKKESTTKAASPKLPKKSKSFPKKPHRREKSLKPNREVGSKGRVMSTISSLTSWTGSSMLDDSTASVVPTKPQDIFRSKAPPKNQESTPKSTNLKQEAFAATPQRKNATPTNDDTPIRHNRATPPTVMVPPTSPEQSKASSIPLPTSYSISVNEESLSTTNDSLLGNMTKRAVDNVMENLLFDNDMGNYSVKSMPKDDDDEVDSYFDDKKEESVVDVTPEQQSSGHGDTNRVESTKKVESPKSVNEEDNKSTMLLDDNDGTHVSEKDTSVSVSEVPVVESASEDDCSYFDRSLDVASLALEDAMSALEKEQGTAPDHWHFNVRSLRHKKDDASDAMVEATEELTTDEAAAVDEQGADEQPPTDEQEEEGEEEVALIAPDQELEPNMESVAVGVSSEVNALVVLPTAPDRAENDLLEDSVCSSHAASKVFLTPEEYDDVSLSSNKSKQLVVAVTSTTRNASWWQSVRDVETGSNSRRSGKARKSDSHTDPDEEESFTLRKTFMILFLIIGIAAITGGIAALVTSKRQDTQSEPDPTVQVPSPPRITAPPSAQASPGSSPAPTAVPTVSFGEVTMPTDPPAAFRLPTDDSPTAAPVSDGTILPTIDHSKLTLHERIELFSPESLPALDNATTPQAQALEWALQQPIPSLEQYSLATLYYSSTEDWSNDDGWVSSSNVCEWYGIVCTDDKVTEITLSFNNLASTLPAELSILTDLQVLSISGAAGTGKGKGLLTGSIPSSWGERLVNLVALELYDNQLTGEIPTTFKYLTDLEMLNLDGNELFGPLPELGTLTKLDILDLSNNELSGSIPSEVGLLTNLVNLKLHDNEFTGLLPPELGNLSSLTELQAQDNVLMGSIPRVLYSLSSLTWLDLSGNELDGILPPSIGLLSNVEGLLLDDNRFNGKLPVQLSMLTNVRDLNLAKNVFSGTVPSQLGLLENIATLSLETNLLQGTIPEDICDLDSLKELSYSEDCGVCPCCTSCQDNN